MSYERRVHPRATVRLPARIRSTTAEPWSEALVLDLSAGGAGVYAGAPARVQSEIRLRFTLPRDEESGPLEILGLVVRAAAPPGSHPGLRHFLGVHFLDLHGEAYDRVRKYVWVQLHPEVG